MIKKNEFIDLCMSLFQEYKNVEELENKYMTYWGANFDDYFNNEARIPFIRKKYCTLKQEHASLFNEYARNYKFMCFFQKITKDAIDKLIAIVNNSNLIVQKKNVQKQLVFSLFIKIYQISFRALLSEYENLKSNGYLNESDEKSNYIKFDLLIATDDFINDFFDKYRELYSIINIKSQQFVDFVEEIINNTERNIDNINRHLNCNVNELVQIELSAGDTHNRGKSVCILHFDQDTKVVYKPRNFGAEKAFDQVLKYLNDSPIEGFLKLKSCKFFSTDAYGWMEYINHSAVNSEEEINFYYRRMGELLCILFLLNAKDFHAENVICCGEYPYLVDLETLLHASFFKDGVVIEGACNDALNYVDDSVLKTGLLPMQILNPKTNIMIEIGAMGMSGQQKSPYLITEASENSNGEIVFRKKHETINFYGCHPSINNKYFDAVLYIDDVIEGFRVTYSYISKNKEKFSLLVKKAFSNVVGRIILRSTNIYTQLIETSYHPLLLEDSICRKAFFLKLFDSSTVLDDELCKSELLDMYHNDVPYFWYNSNEQCIYDSYGVKKRFVLSDTMMNKSLCKINQMCDIDLKRQISFIRISFLDEFDAYKIPDNQCIDNIATVPSVKVNQLQPIEYIKKILEIIKEKSFLNKNSCISKRTWLEVNRIPEYPNYVSFITADLYGGLSGVGLALDKCAELLGDSSAKELSEDIEFDLLNNFSKIVSENTLKPGAFNGILGIVYWLCKKKNYKEKFLSSVHAVINSICNCMVDDCDIILGKAGMMKVLLLVREKFNLGEDVKRKIDEALLQLKEQMIDKAIYESDDSVYWGVEGFVGYAHGVAGIIDALADYYKVYHADDVLFYIASGYNYISKQFSKTANNWQKSMQKKEYSKGWCHGAPGIALLQCNLIEIFGEKIVTKKDLQKTCEIIIANGFGTDFCMCHGDSGNLVILKKCAKLLSDEKLLRMCHEKLDDMLNSMYDKIFGDYFYYFENNGLMLGIVSIIVAILDIKYNMNIGDVLSLH